jgi:hypothetical protein
VERRDVPDADALDGAGPDVRGGEHRPGHLELLVPAITKAGFHTLAWILTAFVTASALLGLFFAPSNAGKSLDDIQRERDGEPADEPRFTREGVGERARAPKRVASG